MFRRAFYLVAVLVLTATLPGCQSEPLAEAVPLAVASTDTEAKVLPLLTGNRDGTVAIADETKMAAMLGKSWPGAKGDLASLNQRIRSGRIGGFKSTADLVQYTRNEPSYQRTLDETGEVNYTSA